MTPKIRVRNTPISSFRSALRVTPQSMQAVPSVMPRMGPYFMEGMDHKESGTETDTHTHTHIHTDTQTHRHTDTQTHRHTHTDTHTDADAQNLNPNDMQG